VFSGALTAQQLIAFGALALLLTLLPGPDTALVIRAALLSGRRGAIKAAAGLWSLSALFGLAVLAFCTHFRERRREKLGQFSIRLLARIHAIFGMFWFSIAGVMVERLLLSPRAINWRTALQRLSRVVALSLALGVALTSASAATPSTVAPTLTAKIPLPSDLDDISQIISSGNSWAVVGNVEKNPIATSPLFPNEASKGESDGYVAMLDPALHLIWSHRFGTAHDDVATAIARDSAGVIWSVGVTTNQVAPSPSATPSVTIAPSPTPTVNPDGVLSVTPPISQSVADQLLISSWNSQGDLLSQNLHSVIDGVAINPSALVASKIGVYVVGTALEPQAGTSRGFYLLIRKDGSLGPVHWVGSKAVVLRAATLLSNGSLVVAGSIAEALKGKPAIGLTDALIEVVNPTSGVVVRTQRSGNKSALRSWESVNVDRLGNLSATGLSRIGKKSEVIFTSFVASLAVRFSLQLAAPLGTQVAIPAPTGSFAALALASLRRGRSGIETYLAPMSTNGRLIAPTYLVGKTSAGLVAAASGKGYVLASSDASGLTLSWFAPRSGK
jgi:hypothetical protein